MKYLPIGEFGMQASIIGLGAWAIGGGKPWGGGTDDDESIRTIHAALDEGINLIDTAPAYGFGRSERVIGEAIRDRRDQILIATKCGLWWKDERGSFFGQIGDTKVNRSLRPDTIAIEIEDSLERLGTDYIDLYQTHWPAVEPDKTPIEDTVAALITLRDAGKIREFGVSNVSPEELEENLRRGPAASDQFRYSMLYRQPERDILPLCKKHGLATLTYMSLEQGLLTGKVTLETEFKEGDFRTNPNWNPWYLPANRRRVLDMLESWKPICEQYHCTLAQLTLAWTAAQNGVTHVLAGGRRPGQITDTAKAADIEISADDLQRLRRDVEALGEPVVEEAKA